MAKGVLVVAIMLTRPPGTLHVVYPGRSTIPSALYCSGTDRPQRKAGLPDGDAPRHPIITDNQTRIETDRLLCWMAPDTFMAFHRASLISLTASPLPQHLHDGVPVLRPPAVHPH